MTTEDELEAYFTRVAGGAYSGLLRLGLNLLTPARVGALTRRFSSHPSVCHLDGLVLDDPETSDHHVLLRQAPFAGQVLFLAHDGDSRVVFASLAAFLDAADEAKVHGVALEALHPRVSPRPAAQSEVSRFIADLLDQGEADVALMLMASMDLADTALLTRLVSHQDFLLGEAVALEIAKRPSPALKPVAALCAAHSHPQVARAGALAWQAVQG